MQNEYKHEDSWKTALRVFSGPLVLSQKMMQVLFNDDLVEYAAIIKVGFLSFLPPAKYLVNRN